MAVTADRVASVMERYEAVIGIEVHCQLRDARARCSAAAPRPTPTPPRTRMSAPSAWPCRALPVLNRRAVEFVIATGLAIDAAIPERTQWDRKNYFYPDMPKSYQISQYDDPARGARAAGD